MSRKEISVVPACHAFPYSPHAAFGVRAVIYNIIRMYRKAPGNITPQESLALFLLFLVIIFDA